MCKRLVAGLGVAASLVLAAGCASSASSPGAPANPLDLPQLTLRPASGPPGTHVTISGHLSPAQVRLYEGDFRRPAYFSLITDIFANCSKDPANCTTGPASLTGCELIVGLIDPVVSLDTATGRVSGSFTVGREGNCFQDNPTGHLQAPLPGRYALAIGAHATDWAPFKVTG